MPSIQKRREELQHNNSVISFTIVRCHFTVYLKTAMKTFGEFPQMMAAKSPVQIEKELLRFNAKQI